MKLITKDFLSGMKTVSVACLTAGMVIGSLNLTGATLRLTFVFVDIAQGNQLALMVCVTFLCILLGMGLPTPAAYSVAAAFAAPALVEIGISRMASHLFVLYYASLSSITPPVALAAYAAASLSGGSPMRTGWVAWRLALVGFIVPFMFVYGPPLLIGQASVLLTIQAVITGIIGVFFLCSATIGYFLCKINIPERIIFVAAALVLLYPGTITDVIGVLIGGSLLCWHYFKSKRLQRIDPQIDNN